MKLFRRTGQHLAAEGVDLVTIPNVPIISTGIEYPLATGLATFTEDDLRDAVRAAEEDPNVQHPRLKLAYGGPHEEAVINEPAFGKVINLRLGNNDQTIFGDYVGVPKWLAPILPVAYPARSIEGNRNCETVGGNKYRLVISNVSLLGVHLPGVTSLPDLAAYYGPDMPDGTLIDSPIQASVSVEDVRRAYYDKLEAAGPEYAWWWIRAMDLEASGGYLIVDDDQGNLFKVQFDVNGEEVTYSEPEEVKIVYENVPKSKMAASVVSGMADINKSMTVYATRADSRPTTATKEGGSDLDTKALAKRLGLPEDATEEQIYAKLDEMKGEEGETETPPTAPQPVPGTEPGTGPAGPPAVDPTAPKGDPAGPAEEQEQEDEETTEPETDDQGLVRMTPEMYKELVTAGKAAQKVVTDSTKQHRERIVAQAAKDGKISPASRENFLRLYEQDPDQTEKLLTASVEDGGLAAGLVPVQERGTGGSGDEAEAEGLPESWFGNGIAAAKKRAEKNGPVTMAREG